MQFRDDENDGYDTPSEPKDNGNDRLDLLDNQVAALLAEIEMLADRVSRLEGSPKPQKGSQGSRLVTVVKIFFALLPFIGIAIGFYLLWYYGVMQ
jgi:hypothetical protein